LQADKYGRCRVVDARKEDSYKRHLLIGEEMLYVVKCQDLKTLVFIVCEQMQLMTGMKCQDVQKAKNLVSCEVLPPDFLAPILNLHQ